jgi:hypothetical protein
MTAIKGYFDEYDLIVILSVERLEQVYFFFFF